MTSWPHTFMQFLQTTLPTSTDCVLTAKNPCFYKRVLAKGEKPRAHSEKPPFLTNILKEKQKSIILIYSDLTSTELLERCLKGRTQNANESLHS